MFTVNARSMFPKTVAAVVAALALAATAGAAVAAGSDPGHADEHQDMLEAIKRDLGLSTEQALARIDAERVAAEQEQLLSAALGDTFAGAWIDQKTLQLVVATTDPDARQAIHATGARPVLHAHSLATLEQVLRKLDTDLSRGDADAFAAWYVEPSSNQVVLLAYEDSQDRAAAVVAQSRVQAGMIRIELTDEVPQLLHTFRGGDAYHKGAGPHCSVGFAVSGGFVTAGHCGNQGETVTAPGGASVGSFAQSTFPGSDMAYVALNPGSSTLPSIKAHGTSLNVVGSAVAPIGATVCRSGYSTGYQCGTIGNRPASVNYSGNIVNGLTQTSACAWFGDSGGSFISATGHGQGVTSGGSLGVCSIYFQPLAPILSSYGLSLLTASGAPTGSAPSITSFNCPDWANSGANRFSCDVGYSASGPTSVSWFVNGQFLSNRTNQSSIFFVSCFPNSSTTVQVRIANLHGSATQQSTFTCPGGLIP